MKTILDSSSGDGTDSNAGPQDSAPFDYSAFPPIQDEFAPGQAPTVTAATGGSPGGTGAFNSTITHAGSGLVFVNTYGSGVTTNFYNAIVSAETYLESHFTNSVTIHAAFDLQAMSTLFSGQNSFNPITVSFSALVSAMASHETSAADIAAVTKLQSMSDPSGGAGFQVSVGEARALGLLGAGSGTDDTVILNNVYWNDTSIGNNMGDAVGVLMHELSEGAMGRIGGQWAPMDLFRYTASGVLDDTGGQDGLATYFSPNGQNINTGLQFHNPINASGQDDGFDWADWDQVGQDANAHDPFGPGGPGAGDPGILSTTDLQIMDVLGWRRELAPAGDLTGSTVSDVLWRNSTNGQVDAWLMNGGSVGSTDLLGTVSSAWQLVGSAELNNTPTADLLWRDTTTGAVQSWLINNGQMVGGTGVGTASSAWQAVGMGDFNDDGTSDVMWRNTTTGAVEDWLINNGQIVGGGGVGNVSSAWQPIGTGDFNGDGTADVAWWNTTTGEVDTWLIQNGHISGGAALGFMSSASWKPLGTGDFDGNGTDDLLWQNTSTGQVEEWLMQNGQVTATPVLGTAPSGAQVASIGDFYGTGAADILWHNASTGTSTVWQISGGALVGTHGVTTLATNMQALPITSAG